MKSWCELWAVASLSKAGRPRSNDASPYLPPPGMHLLRQERDADVHVLLGAGAVGSPLNGSLSKGMGVGGGALSSRAVVGAGGAEERARALVSPAIAEMRWQESARGRRLRESRRGGTSGASSAPRLGKKPRPVTEGLFLAITMCVYFCVCICVLVYV